MNPCDFCLNEGRMVNSSAYCAGCRKYYCAVCRKSHEAFLSDHGRDAGTDIHSKEVNTCEGHIGQELEWFCEKDVCLLCKVCKREEHKQCTVRKIEDIVIEKNVTQEFLNRLADLNGLRDTVTESKDQIMKHIEIYTKRKDNSKERIDHIQRGLNDVFDKFKRYLENETKDVDVLHARLISYRYLHEKIEKHLRYFENLKTDKCTDGFVFASAVKLMTTLSKLKALSNALQINIRSDDLYKINDPQLPSLIRELTAMVTKQLYKPEISETNAERSQSDSIEQLKIDQSYQTDDQSDNRLLLSKDEEQHKRQVSEENMGQIGNTTGNRTSYIDEIEQGSSEEISELPKKHCFDDIKSCTLLKEFSKCVDLTNACLMPNGDVVVCEAGSVRIYNNNMELQYQFDAQDSVPKHVAAIDEKSVVLSAPQNRILQFMQVIPNIGLGEVLKITCQCDGLACYKKHLYIYTENLDESSCVKYSGVQIISFDGQVLNRIELLDKIYCFNVNKDGSFIYFGCRQGTKVNFIKCVSTDGKVLTQHTICEHEKPNAIISDDSNNSIICSPYAEVIKVVKPDGSHSRDLVTRIHRGRLDMLTACFSKHSNILIMAYRDYYKEYTFGRESYKHDQKVRIYQIDMNAK